MRVIVIEARRSFDKRIKRVASWTKRKQGLKDFDVAHDKRSDAINLDLIQVHKGKRKQGAGTRSIQMLTKFADRHKKRVTLSLADKDKKTGTTSRGRLAKFYKRHGFVKNKGRHKDFSLSLFTNMYRQPQ